MKQQQKKKKEKKNTKDITLPGWNIIVSVRWQKALFVDVIMMTPQCQQRNQKAL